MEEFKVDSGKEQSLPVTDDAVDKAVETCERPEEVGRELVTMDTVSEAVTVTGSEKPQADDMTEAPTSHEEHMSEVPKPHEENMSEAPKPHEEEMSEAPKPHEEHMSEAPKSHGEEISEAPKPHAESEAVHLYRNAESSDSCSSSSVSSESDLEVKDDDDSDTEVSQKKRHFPILKTHGELLLEDLPGIEELHVTVTDDIEMKEAGKILNVVGVLVIVQSAVSLRALDEATIFFLEDRTVLGQVYETFGPVTRPLYQVRFNSEEEIERRGIKPGLAVYHAPNHGEFTRYVFLSQLRQLKGSDASWENNNEPPAACIEYSDDEDEREAKKTAKAVRKQKRDDGKEGKDAAEEKPMTDRQKRRHEKRLEYRAARGRGQGQGQGQGRGGGGGRGRGRSQNWDEPKSDDDTCSLDCWPPKPRHFKDSSYVNPRFRPPMPPAAMMPAQSASIVAPGAAFTAPPPSYTAPTWFPQPPQPQPQHQPQPQPQPQQILPSPMFGMFPPPQPGAFPYQMQGVHPQQQQQQQQQQYPPATGPYFPQLPPGLPQYSQHPPPQYTQSAPPPPPPPHHHPHPQQYAPGHPPQFPTQRPGM